MHTCLPYAYIHRERERERERETDRDRDRQRERERERLTLAHTQAHTQRLTPDARMAEGDLSLHQRALWHHPPPQTLPTVEAGTRVRISSGPLSRPPLPCQRPCARRAIRSSSSHVPCHPPRSSTHVPHRMPAHCLAPPPPTACQAAAVRASASAVLQRGVATAPGQMPGFCPAKTARARACLPRPGTGALGAQGAGAAPPARR